MITHKGYEEAVTEDLAIAISLLRLMFYKRSPDNEEATKLVLDKFLYEELITLEGFRPATESLREDYEGLQIVVRSTWPRAPILGVS